MVKNFKRYIVTCLLSIVFFLQSNAIFLSEDAKNVLLINSYHPGYVWTDSLTAGIISTLNLNPEINLYIEYLYSKQFGQANFEIEKEHIQNKYAKISFDGILVTDNDALDFVFKYKDSLFTNPPIVFAGIPNPDDYPLDGSNCYGFPETGNSESVLSLVRKLLPESKRILILADLTTTGIVYRNEFQMQAINVNDLIVTFPSVIDLDSIYEMVKAENVYDAIYYFGIGRDKYGDLVDFGSLLDTICQLSSVPIFANGQQADASKIVGGMYQSGKVLGKMSAAMLIQLMDSTVARPEKPLFETPYEYFFDQEGLDKYNIPMARIPEGSKLINVPQFPIRRYFFVLIGILVILIGIVMVLIRSNRKTKKTERHVAKQFEQVQTQNTELTDAYDKLNAVLAELENTNLQLNESNINLQEAKKRAEESDALKSAFLANVSHEIRTPLNSIVGFSSLLCEADLDEETKLSYNTIIEFNSESLLVLIDEIIDLSKIEAQQLSVNMKDFSFDQLFDQLHQQFKQSNRNENLEINIKGKQEGMDLWILSDRVRVSQIITNLLSNAVKFTESGMIEMGYFVSDSEGIVCYVKDTGIGIAKEYHTAIFNRFRKLNDDSNKVFRGTGLGLAITQKLIGLLGGKIWLESEPGKGSAFFFTLDGFVLKEIAKS